MRLSKICKDLGIGIQTLIEFLERNDSRDYRWTPMTIVSDETYELILNNIESIKPRVLRNTSLGNHQRTISPNENEKKQNEIPKPLESPKVKVLGRIDLDRLVQNKSQQNSVNPESWSKVISAYKNKEVVSGLVKRIAIGNKGLIIEIFGIDTFLPIHLIKLHNFDDLPSFVDEHINVGIIGYDEDTKKIKIRPIYESENVAFDNFREGQIVDGTVVKLLDNGALVSFNDVQGLIKNGDISRNKVSHPSEFLHEGQPVKAVILRIDKEKKRIALGLKQLQKDLWDDVETVFPIGSIHEGFIKKVMTYGAFVQMPNGITGLVHRSDISWNFCSNAQEFIEENQTVEVLVLGIDRMRKRLSLGMKQLTETPFKAFQKVHVVGDCLNGVVTRIEKYGLFVRLDGNVVGLIPKKNVDWFLEIDDLAALYSINDQIRVKLMNIDLERNRLLLSAKEARENPWLSLIPSMPINTIYKAKILLLLHRIGGLYLELENGLRLVLTKKKMSLDLQSRIAIEKEEIIGKTIEVKLVYKDEIKGTVSISEKQLWKNHFQEKIHEILTVGQKVSVRVLGVNKSYIVVQHEAGKSKIRRTETSWKPADDLRTVFKKDQYIDVVFLGVSNSEDFPLALSIKALDVDYYPEESYKNTIDQVLSDDFNIKNNRFVGELNRNNSYLYFDKVFENGEDGLLLSDPYTGKNLRVLAKIDKDEFLPGYYEFEIGFQGDEIFRRYKHSPYQFEAVSPKFLGKEFNPYQHQVNRAFRKHISPSSNRSLANLLREVGLNMYSSKKRMFFELLQNADDCASRLGVHMSIRVLNDYIIFSHNGQSFSISDFISITSAASSNKLNKARKTGYKGIGFKSVFSHAEKVFVNTGGFSFLFDKTYPLFDNFTGFYFLVNKKESDEDKADFLETFYEEAKHFRHVEDIPWPLLPIWIDKEQIPQELADNVDYLTSNVGIAIKMPKDIILQYSNEIADVLKNPTFMLFLRDAKKISLSLSDDSYCIEKLNNGDEVCILGNNDITNAAKYRVCLGDSENTDSTNITGVPVNDEYFKECGFSIKKEARVENDVTRYYFVNSETNKDIPNIPDKIAQASTTYITIAVGVDESGSITPIDNCTNSLFSYLPLTENRFVFPFYINADFVLKSDREGIQEDSPWNHFLFYQIGLHYAGWVHHFASINDNKYLNLLKKELFDESILETSELARQFNKGYKESLLSEPLIIIGNGKIVSQDKVAIDTTGLSRIIGTDYYQTIIGTSKFLPHSELDSSLLKNRDIFPSITHLSWESLYNALNPLTYTIRKYIRNWIQNVATEQQLDALYEWFNNDVPSIWRSRFNQLLSIIPLFSIGDRLYSYNYLRSDDAILLDEHLLGIRDILVNIGFRCINSDITKHVLWTNMSSILNKNYFDVVYTQIIRKSSVEGLQITPEQKVLLFKAVHTRFEIRQLNSWTLFCNTIGSRMPLSSLAIPSLAPSTKDSPIFEYIIEAKEFAAMDSEVRKYLISSSDVFYNLVIDKLDCATNRDLLLDDIKTKSVDQVRAFIKKQGNITLESGKLASIIPFFKAVEHLYADNEIVTYLKNHLFVKGKEKNECLGNITIDADIVVGDLTFALSKLKTNSAEEFPIIASSILNELKTYNVQDSFINAVFNLDNSSKRAVELYNGFKNTLIPNGHVLAFMLAYLSVNKLGSNTVLVKNTLGKSVYIKNHNLYLSTASYINPAYKLHSDYTDLKDYKIDLKSFNIFKRTTSFEYLVQNLSDIQKNDLLDYIYGEYKKDKKSWSSIETTKKDRLKNALGLNTAKIVLSDNYHMSGEELPSCLQNWCSVESERLVMLKTVFSLYDEESRIVKLRKYVSGDLDTKDLASIEKTLTDEELAKLSNWIQFKNIVLDTPRFDIINEYFNSSTYVKVEFDITELETFASKNNPALKVGSFNIYAYEGDIPYCYILKKNSSFVYYRFTKTGCAYVNYHIFISKSDFTNLATHLATLAGVNACLFKDSDFRTFFISQQSQQSSDEIQIIQDENEKLKELNEQLKRQIEDLMNGDTREILERGNNSLKDQISINMEARKAVKEYLDKHGYDVSQWDPEEPVPDIINLIKNPDGYPINVVIRSARGKKIHLAATSFDALIGNPNNLLVVDGVKGLHSVTFKQLFGENSNVNLIFDANYVSKEYFSSLASIFKYVKNTEFVVNDPEYSAYDEIEGFGLDKLQDGSIILTTEEDI